PDRVCCWRIPEVAPALTDFPQLLRGALWVHGLVCGSEACLQALILLGYFRYCRTAVAQPCSHMLVVSRFGRRSARYGNGNWPARMATSGLVFSAADGSVESHVNVTRQVLVPVLRAANMMVPALD